MKSKNGPIRLLLIEDSPDHEARLRDALTGGEGNDYLITRVPGPIAAHTHLKDHPVDVILVDPELFRCAWNDGFSKLHEAALSVPIIALTAAGDGEATGVALAAGAQDYLIKGFPDRELLKRVIHHACEQWRLKRKLDVTEEKLERLALVDPLTELPNRRAIERSLLRELRKCRRLGSGLLVLLVGLDNFKKINGSLNHRVGDIVLCKAGERISSALRASDEVGRAGDDEFLVLLPDTRVAEGMVVAERIRLAIAQDLVKVVGNTVQVTASLGLTTVTPDTMSITEALAKAHVALHRAKQGGKNRVACVLEPDGHEIDAAAVIGEEMVRALLYDDVLAVAAQPIVRLEDQVVLAQEMLIRGPAGPLQRPDQLFRFSVEQDILTALDLRCLRQCVAAAGVLGGDYRYHVNIMPSTLLETEPRELIDLLGNDGRPDRFCLEISEQQLLGDPSYLAPNVKTLQAAGVEVAIDDVGFGHSCLEGLILLRPQIMKVDKKMVIGLGQDKGQRCLLQRLLRVAEVLETTVIAEGIETPEDLVVLQELGVEIGQGYYFGRPRICSGNTSGATTRPARTSTRQDSCLPVS